MSEQTETKKKKTKQTSPAVKALLIIVIILCIGVMGFSEAFHSLNDSYAKQYSQGER